MINFINSYDYKESKTSIVVSNDDANSIIKELNKSLNNVINSKLSNEKINTLNNFKFKNIYVVKNNEESLLSALKKVKEEVVVLLDTFELKEEELFNVALNSANSRYSFTKYKKGIKTHRISFTSTKDLSKVVSKALIYSEGVSTTKDLINTPYNDLDAHDLADFLKKMSKETGIESNIIEQDEIEKMKMGAFLSVNKGSAKPALLIQLKYQGKSDFKDPLTIVGKGVMYDTGGYSLKVGGNMAGMKCDMGGAATAIGAIQIAARMKVKENIMLIIAATDNAINEKASYVDDVVTSMKGLTIEIGNTDAEGRLTLCDAITFAQKEGSKRIVDIATLTGGVIASLGTELTGTFTNDQTFLDGFMKVCKNEKEEAWQLPVLNKYYKDAITKSSKVADLHNISNKKGQASLAAAFLHEFIEKGTKWIHLDIAGTAFNANMATGAMVRSLATFISNN